jgi:hypothetical protein
MKARLLLTLKGLAIGSMLPRVLIVALLTGNSNAASLQPSETRQKGEDLQVITLDSQGYRAKTLYYSYDSVAHIADGYRENRARSEHKYPSNLHWYLYQ